MIQAKFFKLLKFCLIQCRLLADVFAACLDKLREDDGTADWARNWSIATFFAICPLLIAARCVHVLREAIVLHKHGV